MYKDKLVGSKECLSKTLYIIPTPIGNLEDITLRALRILTEVEWLICEDTRVTAKLLSLYNIASKKTLTYHDYSNNHILDKIITLLDEGRTVGLVSDAGTPLISDPGYKIVQRIRSEGYKLEVLPGPCSAITGLVLSGLPTDKFYFIGFCPNKSGKRKNFLQNFLSIEGSLIFFERAERCNEFLADVLTVLGDRRVALVREISKIYEEVKTSLISELELKMQLKGELIIVVEGHNKSNTERIAKMAATSSQTTEEKINNIIVELSAQGLGNKDIVQKLVQDYQINKNQAYRAVLKKQTEL